MDGGPALPWCWGAVGLPPFFNPKMSPLAIAVCKEAVQVDKLLGMQEDNEAAPGRFQGGLGDPR